MLLVDNQAYHTYHLDMPTKDYLTVTQVKDKLGITRQAVLKAIKEKRIKAKLIDSGPVSFYMIHKREIKKFK